MDMDDQRQKYTEIVRQWFGGWFVFDFNPLNYSAPQIHHIGERAQIIYRSTVLYIRMNSEQHTTQILNLELSSTVIELWIDREQDHIHQYTMSNPFSSFFRNLQETEESRIGRLSERIAEWV